MTAFDILQAHYLQRDLAARAWKAQGGRVVGYCCDVVPEELVLAAGFFPLRLTGDPAAGTEEIDKYLEPFYEGFVRSQLNRLLTGKYDYVDYLIIPRSRDSVAQQHSSLSQIRELQPAVSLPEMYLFEFIHTRSYASQFYTRDRVRDLACKLEEWSGKPISKQALGAAITVTNENRALLQQVIALRRAQPPRVSGVQALQIIGSSMFMLKEEHNRLLRDYLRDADRLDPKPGARLFVEGSPTDNLQLYELVESCDAVIVGEDNCWGERHCDDPIAESAEPLEAIASRYHYKSPCPFVVYPAHLRADYCTRKVMDSGARGVLFNLLEWDPAQTWDYAEQRRAVQERGLPTLCFKQQKYSLPGDERDRHRREILEFLRLL